MVCVCVCDPRLYDAVGGGVGEGVEGSSSLHKNAHDVCVSACVCVCGGGGFR